MARVSRQRAIIDRGALNAELDRLLDSGKAAGHAAPRRSRGSQAGRGARRGGDPPALRGRARGRPAGPERAVLPDGPAHPCHLRPCRQPGLPRLQPDRGRASVHRRRGRLRARRARALLRHRPPVRPALQERPAQRAARRIRALHAVGSRAQGRSRHADDRGLHPALPERPDDTHFHPRGALCLGREAAVPPAAHAVPRRGGQGFRARLRRGQARRARRTPPAHGRLALRARTQCQGRQGGAARPAHPVLDRQEPLPGARDGASRRARGPAGERGGAFRKGAALPVHRPLPPALHLGPGRRPAHLRPPARDRRPARLQGTIPARAASNAS